MNARDDGGEHEVLDFKQARSLKLEEKRRTNEREFFRRLLSAYSIFSDDRMCAVDLVDVDEQSCSFQVPYDPQKPWPSDMTQFPMRLYFSPESFVEIYVQVCGIQTTIEGAQRYRRIGCSVDRTASTYPAYQSFVRFLKQYSLHAQADAGDVGVFFF